MQFSGRRSRESPRDDRVYDFKVFLDPDFVFVPHPELGIKSAEVRQIGMRILGSEQYTIMACPTSRYQGLR